MDKEYKLLQVNAQRSRLVMAQLRKQFDDSNIDILAIQEPYCVGGRITGFGGLRVVSSDNAQCMSAIVVRNREVTVVKIESLTDMHGVCVAIEGSHGIFYVISLYCQSCLAMEPFAQYIQRASETLRGNRMVVCMDSNAKSETWFSNDLDDRGTILKEVLMQSGLHVVNQPSDLMTSSTVNGESNIDLTVSSHGFLGEISGWTVRDDVSTSDHRAIEFTIARVRNRQNRSNEMTRYRVPSADWDKFDDLIK